MSGEKNVVMILLLSLDRCLDRCACMAGQKNLINFLFFGSGGRWHGFNFQVYFAQLSPLLRLVSLLLFFAPFILFTSLFMHLISGWLNNINDETLLSIKANWIINSTNFSRLKVAFNFGKEMIYSMTMAHVRYISLQTQR